MWVAIQRGERDLREGDGWARGRNSFLHSGAFWMRDMMQARSEVGGGYPALRDRLFLQSESHPSSRPLLWFSWPVDTGSVVVEVSERGSWEPGESWLGSPCWERLLSGSHSNREITPENRAPSAWLRDSWVAPTVRCACQIRCLFCLSLLMNATWSLCLAQGSSLDRCNLGALMQGK